MLVHIAGLLAICGGICMKKKDNRGLSMVEMIIVVAIVSVVAGAVFLGIGFVTGKPAEKCANKLLSLMQRNRITTMGKLEARLEIYMEEEGGNRYLCVKEVIQTDGEAGPKVTTTRIGEAGVEVTYRISGETTYQTLGGESSPLIISYDRSSGAFKDLSLMGSSLAGRYCEEIKIEKANKIKILKLVARTGKITME